MLIKKSKPNHNLFISIAYLPHAWAILLTVLFGVLYFLTMPKVNVGYPGSPEILLTAYEGGFYRSPGHPLYLALLRFFVSLPIAGFSLAAKGHLLSVILSSFTIYLSFYNFWELFKVFKRTKSFTTEPLLISLVSTLSLGLIPFFFLYSHIADTPAFTCLILAIFMNRYIAILNSPQAPKKSLRLWLPLTFIIGLGLAHLQILLFLLPAVIYLIYQKKRQFSTLLSLLAIAFLIFGFALPYIVSYQTHNWQSAFSWPVTFTYEGFKQYLIQGDFQANQGLQAYFSNGLNINTTYSQIWLSFTRYLYYLLDAAGWWLLPVLALAIFSGLKYHQKKWLSLSVVFISLSVLPALYYTWPNDWADQAILTKIYLPGFTLIPYVLYLGWQELFSRLNHFFNVLVSPKVYSWIIIVVLSIILSLSALKGYHFADLSSYTLVSDRYQAILNQAKKNALITCFSDVSCFSLQYEQKINHLRPDITLVTLAYPYTPNLSKTPDLKGFEYNSNPYQLLDIISWNLDKRPVYVVELSEYYNQSLGFDFPYFFYLPQGYMGELSRKVPANIPEVSETVSDPWLKVTTQFNDPTRLFHKSMPARDHIYNALWYNRMGFRDIMLQEMNQAAEIYFQFSAEDKKMFTGMRNSVEQNRFDPRYKPLSVLPKVKSLLNSLPEMLKQNQNTRAFKTALAATYIEPTNVAAHLALAQIFEKMGDNNFAIQEYRNVLRLDKNQTEAKTRIELLKNSQ
jgi:hypothetical protein